MYLSLPAPGFGLKFLVAPILEILYQTPQRTQDYASVIFLVSYAVTRLLTGILTMGRCAVVKPLTVMISALCTSAVLLVTIAGVVKWGPVAVPNGSNAPSTGSTSPGGSEQNMEAYQWAFILLATGVGSCLAAMKVTFLLILLEMYGIGDYAVALGVYAAPAFLAAVWAPITAWLAVSLPTTPEDIQWTAALWLLLMGLILIPSVLVYVFSFPAMKERVVKWRAAGAS